MRRHLVALLATVLLANACSYRTIGGVTGDRTLVATFEDVQHLVVGHTVRVADVPVGTVTAVRLDGYQAEVEMSVEDGRELPVGTTASISMTSLLGENYVRLDVPDDLTGAMLEDGDEVPTTGADASFEELAGELLAVISAINGTDVATIIDATADAVSGRGPELNQLLRTIGQVTDGLVGQSEDLVALIDSLAVAGQTLAADAGVIGESIERAAEATGALARQRDRVVDAVGALTDAAAAFDDEVLVPHRAQLDRILIRLAPVADTLAANRRKVVDLVDSLREANALVPRVVDRDEVLVYGIFERFLLPGVLDLRLSEIVPLSDAEAVTALLSPTSADAAGAPTGEGAHR